jgi:hypothetical protein
MTTMAKNVKKIAKRLGAKVVGDVPETGGGVFGAGRLGWIAAARQAPAAGRPRYKLAVLMEQCDLSAPMTGEDRAWFNAAPVGREEI